MAQPRIADLVEVRARPTVIRLDDLAGPSPGWITDSFFVTEEIAAHIEALRHAFSAPQGCGVFLIGQYGCGKSHLLAYLTQQLESAALLPQPPVPVALSLLNFRGETALEDVVAPTLGIKPGTDDRRPAWAGLSERYPTGIVLLLDELSEFLRSKPTREALNEDIRFLQFLGEWASGNRLWVVAAMQEQIEHVGKLDSAPYRKIRDRYRLRLLLTPAHVRDLVSHDILVKQAGYEEAVEKLAGAIQELVPEGSLDWEALRAVYPVHPATLELLEEVRDVFSQARGVVDFAVTRLGGDETRQAAPFLERPWGDLLTPDSIVDHFADLLELQPELLPLAQRVLPHYRRHLDTLFSKEAQRELAWRLLKLLVLVHLSPRREDLGVEEAAAWLVLRAARLDPEKNLQILRRTLHTLATDGRYVKEERGRFRLDLADEGSDLVDRLVAAETEDVQAADEEAVWESLAPLADDEPFNPLALPRDRWHKRSVRWHFHDREWNVFLGNATPSLSQGPALVIRLPWGEAGPAPRLATLEPARMELTVEVAELAALVRLQQRPTAADVKRTIGKRIAERRSSFVAAIQRAYLEATLMSAGGEQLHSPRQRPATTAVWLDTFGERLLHARFPAFERFAPRGGPVPKEAYRTFMRAANQRDVWAYEEHPYVKLIREAYLVPLRLMRRDGMSYAPSPRLGQHELVRALMPLVERQASPAVIYEQLADPPFGLVPDQIHLLLIFLLLQGDLDIVKQHRSYRELFETLPHPVQYDRVLAAAGLSAEHLKALDELCRGLAVRHPKQWTVAAQREAIARLRGVVHQEHDRLQRLLLRLEEVAGGEELAAKVRRCMELCTSLDKGESELEGLQHLLFASGGAAPFLHLLEDLRNAAQRLPPLLGELKRLQHLLAHPWLAEWPDPDIQTRLAELAGTPPLAAPDELDRWVEQARALYDHYLAGYRQRHDAFWKETASHQVWSWQFPAIATSRHIGLDRDLAALATCRERAEKLRCQGLTPLDFQPRCRCLFDGSSAAVNEELTRFDEMQGRVASTLKLFFAQSSVRERMGEWSSQGVELSEGTVGYLEGREALPTIEDISLLDRFLAGMELVREVDALAVLRELSDRVWEPGELAQAVNKALGRYGSARLRLRVPQQAMSETAMLWCAEQALRHGASLPRELGGQRLGPLVTELRPEWVGGAALARLEELRLGEAIEDRILSWLLDGSVAAQTEGQLSPLVAAAQELIRPSQPTTPEELGQAAATLLGAYPRLSRIAGDLCRDRLEEVTNTPLPGLPELQPALRKRMNHQWVVVDCLGLALLGTLRDSLSAGLPGFRVEREEFAAVPSPTTTASWLAQLADEGLNTPMEKLNAVDRLIHERKLSFDELSRLAGAELVGGLRRVARHLDPERAVVVSADHGFRLASDGQRFVHGGASTLERVVPLIDLVPA